MQRIIKHFRKVDPLLHGAMLGKDWTTLTRTHDYFTGLCYIIIGQQVSTKAAKSIFFTFCLLFPKNKPTVKKVLQLAEIQLRGAGLSAAKAGAIRDLAIRIENKSLSLTHLKNREDLAVSAELVKVKGIGPWSAEIFLIFYLGREDVFSPGDLGLRTAIMKLYNKRKLPSPEQAARFAKKWAPYRSYACRILWQSLNNTTAK